MRLQAVNILSRDASSSVVSGVEDQIQSLQRKDSLQDKPRLRVTPIVGASAWQSFEQRRVIELVYDSHPTELWEIEQGSFRRGDSAGRKQVQCRPLWMRLRDQVAYVRLSGGGKETDLSNTAVSPNTALSRVLSADWNAPALFAPGTVDNAIQGRQVNTFVSAGTHEDHLTAIRDDLACEWEVRWDSAAGEYKIDLVERIGSDDASLRTIRETQQSQGEIVNRLQMRDRMRSDQYFSRVMPLGGDGDSTRTIARARWPIASASYDSGANETTITFDQEPVWADGVLTSAQVTDGTGAYAVTGSTAPSEIVVSGDVSGWDVLWFLDGSGDDLIELTDEAAESSFGQRTKPKRFAGVAPYENLLERGGVNTEADTLTGWATLGANTSTSIVTGRDYARNGDGAIEVTTTATDEEEGLRTSPFDYQSSEVGEVLSVHVSLRVGSGRVQVQLVDSDGKEYPPDETIEGGEDTLRGYTISGVKPADGNVFVKVTKLADNTVFYVDAISVVASAKAQGYAPAMGPRGLWQKGAEHLLRQGGEPEREFSGEVIDLSVLEGTGEELMLGDATKVILHDGTSLEARITSTTKELYPGSDSTSVQVGLGKPMDDALSRFLDPDDGTPPNDDGEGTPRVQPVVENIERYQSGSTGYLEFEVSDPLGVVEEVQARTKKGANFEQGDSFSAISPSGGSYTESVGLVQKHNSFIEVKLVTGPQVDDVTRAWEYDIDQIPGAEYDFKWSWNGARPSVEVAVVARGDEDTSSFKFEIDKGGDGTFEETRLVDGQSVTKLLNQATSLTAGETLRIRCTAYSETGQAGTPQPTPLDETFEVPALEGERTRVRPQIEATAEEDPDGTGRVTWTVGDPDGLVTGVEVRTASGRNLKPSDSFGAPSVSDSSPYEETVDLKDGHVSYVEVRLVTSKGENVRSVFPFDPNTDPEADYRLNWRWNPSRGSAELRVEATGDDDVQSFAFGADYDQDGTDDQVHNVDATATTQLINPSQTLSGGDALDLSAVAYSEAGQSGQTQDNPFGETVEVPTLEGERTKERPELKVTTYEQKTISGSETGVLEFEVDDPDGLLTQVDARTSEGDNLDSGDSFSQVSPSSGTYRVEVGLVESHSSFVEVALRVGGTAADITRTFTFDADTIPSADYQVEWQYSGARETVEAKIVARGDEDTSSYEFRLDQNEDGTPDSTVQVDGRNASAVLNPNFGLDPGETVRVWGRAYGAAGQSGTPEPQVYEQTVEVPPLEASSAQSPSLSASTDQEGTTGVLRLQVEDRDNVVTGVKARTAKGRNFVSADAFSDLEGLTQVSLSLDGTTSTLVYEETVGLTEKHPSFIEVLVETASQASSVRRLFPFDADVRPEGSVELRWFYESGLPGMAAEVVATGDDDVESWRFEITDGTNSDTQDVDGQSPTQQLNTTFGLDPGTEVQLTAEAYAETGQSGEKNVILQDTFVVMADVDAIADGDGVVVEGKHILLDGATTVKGGLDIFPATGFGSPLLKQAVQNGHVKARFTLANPQTASGNELTDPLNGRRYKLKGGATVVGTDGPHGVSLYLDGSSSPPYLACESKLEGSVDHFVAGWFKISPGPISGGEILFSYDANEYLRAYLNSAGEVNVARQGSASDLTTGAIVADGRWHHVQVSHYAGQGANRLQVFVDGGLVADESHQDLKGTGTTRFLTVGTGSEASSYDGSIGPSTPIEMYVQDLVVGKGAPWTGTEAGLLHANPDQFMPVGEVHGDLLVDGTVRAEKVDAEQFFTKSFVLKSGGEITNSASPKDFLVDSDGFAVNAIDTGQGANSFDVADFGDGTTYGFLTGSTTTILLSAINGADLKLSSDDKTRIETAAGKHVEIATDHLKINELDGFNNEPVTVRNGLKASTSPVQWEWDTSEKGMIFREGRTSDPSDSEMDALLDPNQIFYYMLVHSSNPTDVKLKFYEKKGDGTVAGPKTFGAD